MMKIPKYAMIAFGGIVFAVFASSAWSTRAAADVPRYRVIDISNVPSRSGLETLLNKEAAIGYRFNGFTPVGAEAIFERR